MTISLVRVDVVLKVQCYFSVKSKAELHGRDHCLRTPSWVERDFGELGPAIAHQEQTHVAGLPVLEDGYGHSCTYEVSDPNELAV